MLIESLEHHINTLSANH